MWLGVFLGLFVAMKVFYISILWVILALIKGPLCFTAVTCSSGRLSFKHRKKKKKTHMAFMNTCAMCRPLDLQSRLCVGSWLRVIHHHMGLWCVLTFYKLREEQRGNCLLVIHLLLFVRRDPAEKWLCLNVNHWDRKRLLCPLSYVQCGLVMVMDCPLWVDFYECWECVFYSKSIFSKSSCQKSSLCLI